MTVCVYRDGKLAADGLVTMGNIAENKQVIKIGKIWEDAVSGQRSLDKDSLEYPLEFAMYAGSGACRHFSRFFRWFISVDHPGIDHDEYLDIEDSREIEDPIEMCIIFKHSNIVRMYDNDYTSDVFVDLPKDSIHTIGSGGIIAKAILEYDPKADLNKVIETVSKVDVFCGGNAVIIEFEEDPEYNEEELDKLRAELLKSDLESLKIQLKDKGINLSVIKDSGSESVKDVKSIPKNFKS